MFHVTSFFLIVLLIQFNDISTQSQSMTALKDSLVTSNYSKYERPNQFASQITVNISLDVLAMYTRENELQANVEIGARWQEPRLDIATILSQSNATKLLLDSTWKDTLWLPDIVMENTENVRIQDRLIQPSTYFLVDGQQNVQMVTRLSVTMTCVENRIFFPHDKKECELLLTSLTSLESDIKFSWTFVSVENPVSQNFRAKAIEVKECLDVDEHDITGPKPCLRVQFDLHRRPSFYIVTKYVPSVVIVLMAFSTFFIPVVVIPARLSLLIAALLGIMYLYEFSLVATPFSTSINLWLLFCFAFVISAFLEFYMAIKEYKANHMDGKNKADDAVENYKENDEEIATMSQLAVDKTAQILFPVLFLLFVFAYTVAISWNNL
ncbi:Glycine receptor subunit alpha-3 [Halotydeus destructor]|nr:Glycine receptor subunit alpha-3 [Halotydeus destructor]